MVVTSEALGILESNFSICYRISTSQLYNIPVASRGPSADDFGTNRKLIYDILSR